MRGYNFEIILFALLLIIPRTEVISQQTIGLFQNDSAALNGYVLWTVGAESYLVDNCGYEINHWSHDTNPGLSVYLLPGGQLLRAGKIDGNFPSAGVGGRIEKYSWEGNLNWSYELNETNIQQHHDIEPLPNGNGLRSPILRSEIEDQEPKHI